MSNSKEWGQVNESSKKSTFVGLNCFDIGKCKSSDDGACVEVADFLSDHPAWSLGSSEMRGLSLF